MAKRSGPKRTAQTATSEGSPTAKLPRVEPTRVGSSDQTWTEPALVPSVGRLTELLVALDSLVESTGPNRPPLVGRSVGSNVTLTVNIGLKVLLASRTIERVIHPNPTRWDDPARNVVEFRMWPHTVCTALNCLHDVHRGMIRRWGCDRAIAEAIDDDHHRVLYCLSRYVDGKAEVAEEDLPSQGEVLVTDVDLIVTDLEHASLTWVSAELHEGLHWFDRVFGDQPQIAGQDAAEAEQPTSLAPKHRELYNFLLKSGKSWKSEALGEKFDVHRTTISAWVRAIRRVGLVVKPGKNGYWVPKGGRPV